MSDFVGHDCNYSFLPSGRAPRKIASTGTPIIGPLEDVRRGYPASDLGVVPTGACEPRPARPLEPDANATTVRWLDEADNLAEEGGWDLRGVLEPYTGDMDVHRQPL